MNILKCPYCEENMMHATDGKYDYGWCPFCFAQSPAVKHVTDGETGEEYTISVVTGKRANIEQAAVINKEKLRGHGNV